MVTISRVYTKTGDDGTTALGDFSRTAKTDPRLAAYADCNEANAALGIALAAGELSAPVRATLTRIQNDLFDVGADLCNPLATSYKYPPLRVQEPWIAELEAEQKADYESRLEQRAEVAKHDGIIAPNSREEDVLLAKFGI